MLLIQFVPINYILQVWVDIIFILPSITSDFGLKLWIIRIMGDFQLFWSPVCLHCLCTCQPLVTQNYTNYIRPHTGQLKVSRTRSWVYLSSPASQEVQSLNNFLFLKGGCMCRSGFKTTVEGWKFQGFLATFVI